ncbi:MAG TPA: hypothetical protein VJP02_17860 [Candidatus Sulfotelmatobacter sp.]|nr:hypothetical protein [Candidatus Sulfotelmatobacter sp.]
MDEILASFESIGVTVEFEDGGEPADPVDGGEPARYQVDPDDSPHDRLRDVATQRDNDGHDALIENQKRDIDEPKSKTGLTRLTLLARKTRVYCPTHKTMEPVVDYFSSAKSPIKLECGYRRAARA